MNNYFYVKYQILKVWFHKKREKNIPVYRIILFHLPLRLAIESNKKIVALINENLINPLFNTARFKEFQNKYKDKLNRHFYVIVMPNMLHFLGPYLSLIPKDINVLLILNGTRRWEEEYLRGNYPGYPIFKLMTLPGSKLSHGSVLNLLIVNNQSDFGIIDHDLYIFNKNIFNTLIFDRNECVIGAFKIINEKSMITFPTTHFMFFNIALIKKIMTKYRIGAQQYNRVPSHLKDSLASLNLGYHNFLKEYLYFFDTFNMILAMAFYEKLSFKILEIGDEDVYHVGCTTHGDSSMYSTYLSLRLLEMPQHSFLKQKYSSLFSEYRGSKDVLERFPADTLSELMFVSEVNKFIIKIEKMCNGLDK